MKAIKAIQFIEKNGRPEWAVLPYGVYKNLLKKAEIKTDEELFDEAMAMDDGFRVPSEVTFAVMDGAHPIRAWREYNEYTQATLAKKAGISTAYLSQIESGKRVGSLDILNAICRILKVPLDVIYSAR